MKPLTDSEYQEVKHRFENLDDYVEGTHADEALRVIPFLIATIELQKSDINLGDELIRKIKDVKNQRDALRLKNKILNEDAVYLLGERDRLEKENRHLKKKLEVATKEAWKA